MKEEILDFINAYIVAETLGGNRCTLDKMNHNVYMINRQHKTLFAIDFKNCRIGLYFYSGFLNEDSFEQLRDYLVENYGYDKYLVGRDNYRFGPSDIKYQDFIDFFIKYTTLNNNLLSN